MRWWWSMMPGAPWAHSTSTTCCVRGWSDGAPMDAVPEQVRSRAAGIRLVAFDVDGTLNDGTLWYPAEGHMLKQFHVHDGLGLKLLREHGIEVALISARDSRAVDVRARELGLRHVQQGTHDKRDALERLARALGLAPAQCAFMGDDLPDLPAMQV